MALKTVQNADAFKMGDHIFTGLTRMPSRMRSPG
jgi:hypothetical protein